ncbi:MAG: hypothetical protein AAGF24_05115 [Cyanobacteria bacterium P01_H01_bin.121]
MKLPQLTAVGATAALFVMPISQPAEAGAIAAPVAYCAAQPQVCAVGLVTIAGIVYRTVTWQGQQTQYYPVIDNPDRQSVEYRDELVWASNPTAARQACEQLAKRLQQQWGTRVALKRVEPHNRAKYRCVFDVEQ